MKNENSDPLLSEGFEKLRLVELTLGNTPLDGSEETYAILSQIPTLTKLSLAWSKVTALPEGFGKMASLEDLSLAYCHALARNEGTFTILSQIPTLTKLNLHGCDMETLPAGIRHPSTVIPTSFSDPHPLSEGFGKLTNLKELNMQSCRNVRTLPEGITQTLILK